MKNKRDHVEISNGISYVADNQQERPF